MFSSQVAATPRLSMLAVISFLYPVILSSNPVCCSTLSVPNMKKYPPETLSAMRIKRCGRKGRGSNVVLILTVCQQLIPRAILKNIVAYLIRSPGGSESMTSPKIEYAINTRRYTFLMCLGSISRNFGLAVQNASTQRRMMPSAEEDMDGASTKNPQKIVMNQQTFARLVPDSVSTV